VIDVIDISKDFHAVAMDSEKNIFSQLPLLRYTHHSRTALHANCPSIEKTPDFSLNSDFSQWKTWKTCFRKTQSNFFNVNNAFF
jgi:hypothetical protein